MPFQCRAFLKFLPQLKKEAENIAEVMKIFLPTADLVVCGAYVSDETLAVLELLHTAVQRAGGGGPRAAHVRVEQLLQQVVLSHAEIIFFLYFIMQF